MNLPLNVDFTGKVVVVTGAGGVMCGDMAKAFAQAGAKVAALDLNKEAVKKLADECKANGWTCEGYKANVLEPEDLEAVHQQVLKDLGPCDILANGAGGNNPRATTDNEYQHEWAEGQKGFFDLDVGGVDFVFKLNFQGTLLPTQALAKSGIRCNAIAPGFLVSNQNRALLFNPDGTPMGRFVDSEELLGGVFFLCDNRAASAITGVVLPIDAGFATYSCQRR